MALFDAYAMVDWSSEARPKRGKDSIWIAIFEREPAGLVEKLLVNAPTRHAAVRIILSRLAELAARGLTALIGFDFAFAYPAGFARALDPQKADWLGVWGRLSRLIEDEDNNANNRFDVAAHINSAMTRGAAPFWGCHRSRVGRFLHATAPATPPFASHRLCETRAKGAQSTWKLSYPGSVGSQTLLGIPRLLALRRSRELAERLRIWPFETGLRSLQRGRDGEIVLAEIWPGIAPDTGTDHPIRDARQVRSWAKEYARLDEAGRLAELFAGDPSLTEAERKSVEREEGWILGVTKAQSYEGAA